MTTRLKKIFGLGLIVAMVTIVLIQCLNAWADDKIEKIEYGMSDSNFPFPDYTPDEISQLRAHPNNSNYLVK
jgi:hypothetical protein